MKRHRFEIQLPRDPCSVRVGRLNVAKALERWDLGASEDKQDNVILVASELLTNAIRHSSSPTVNVRLYTDYQRTRLLLTFEVHDGSAAQPQPRIAKTTDEDGRGLSIVAELASRHGSEQTPAGKRVWAQFVLPSTASRYLGGLAQRSRATAPRPPGHRPVHHLNSSASGYQLAVDIEKVEEAMNDNLYDRPVSGPFAALCGGGTNDGSMEDCISVAELAGGGYALGDTKPEGAGRELRMSRDEITSFAEAWLAQERKA
ncbi:ATP-binding protein [Kitasatospora sp. GAS1066B]|uniref:ATP-binding protein n=1 Tax=Kitasatospora sp. GAS1066B TaxID=3156271 RepID=UPI003513F1E5